jgi:hypothetical protein
MADAFGKFSLTVSTSKLAFVEENKLYMALAERKTADGQQFSGAWEDFYSLIGRSQQHIRRGSSSVYTPNKACFFAVNHLCNRYRRGKFDDCRLVQISEACRHSAFCHEWQIWRLTEAT